MFVKKYIVIVCLCLTQIGWASENTVLNIQHWKTTKGTRVYFVKAPQVPILDIQLVFAAGAARDGKKEGIAALTNALLNQGTETLSADDIATQFDAIGAKYNAVVARDMAVVSLRTLSESQFLKPALTTFQRVLVTPSFPENAFDREKKSQLIALAQQQEQPRTLASLAFYKTIYSSHPYGHPVLGSIGSVKKLQREDVLSFYQRYYVAKNAIIAIVGAVTTEQAKKIAENITKGLSSGRSAKTLPAPKNLKKKIQKHIQYPATRTNIRLGQIGITYSESDYFPLIVGNYTLGGGMLVSRLENEVREKRGLSYSVYSMFFPMAVKGPFLISLGTRGNQTQRALRITQQTLQKFIKEGPTPEEVDAAKKNITGGFPLRLESNRAIMNMLLRIGFYKLPLNYLDTYIDKVNAVTPKQIQKAFQKHLNPNKMAIITVGKYTTTSSSSTYENPKTRQSGKNHRRKMARKKT